MDEIPSSAHTLYVIYFTEQPNTVRSTNKRVSRSRNEFLNSRKVRLEFLILQNIWGRDFSPTRRNFAYCTICNFRIFYLNFLPLSFSFFFCRLLVSISQKPAMLYKMLLLIVICSFIWWTLFNEHKCYN